MNDELIRQYLKDPSFRILRLLTIALAGGPAVFAVLIFSVFQQAAPEVPQGDPEYLKTLTYVNVFLSMGMFYLSRRIPGILLKKLKPRKDGTVPTLLEVRQVLFPAYIFRLAILEGAALFGLVVIFLVQQSGYLNGHPFFVINLLGMFNLMVEVILNFPSEETIRRLLSSGTSGFPAV